LQKWLFFIKGHHIKLAVKNKLECFETGIFFTLQALPF